MVSTFARAHRCQEPKVRIHLDLALDIRLERGRPFCRQGDQAQPHEDFCSAGGSGDGRSAMAERREGAANRKIQTEALPKSAIYAEMVVSDRPGRLWVMHPAFAAIMAEVSLSNRAALTSFAVNLE
jgi:hypothetical protein